MSTDNPPSVDNPSPIDHSLSHLQIRPVDPLFQTLFVNPDHYVALALVATTDHLTNEIFSISCKSVTESGSCYLIPDTISFEKQTEQAFTLWVKDTYNRHSHPYTVQVSIQGSQTVQSLTLPVQVVTFTLNGKLFDWGRQIDSQGHGAEEVKSMVVDAQGYLYVALSSTGGFYQYPNKGDLDTFLFKYDPNGRLVFMTQLATSKSDIIKSLASDEQGNLYAAGITYGAFPGKVSLGGSDIFITKIDSFGKIEWLKQFGTEERDQVSTLVLAHISGSMNLYLAGSTEGVFPGSKQIGKQDAWVASVGENGVENWIQTIGTDDIDEGTSLAVDTDGSFYLGGTTLGTFPFQRKRGGVDIFVAKASKNGVIAWIKQLGSEEDDQLSALSLGKDGLYGAGSVGVDSLDGFVNKWDLDGTKLWSLGVGTSYMDDFTSLVVLPDKIFAIGHTEGFLENDKPRMQLDVMIAEINLDGTLRKVDTLGTDQMDTGSLITTDGDSLYVGGTTFGMWPFPLSKEAYPMSPDSDGFLIKFKLP